jgi:hypothetical protein
VSVTFDARLHVPAQQATDQGQAMPALQRAACKAEWEGLCLASIAPGPYSHLGSTCGWVAHLGFVKVSRVHVVYAVSVVGLLFITGRAGAMCLEQASFNACLSFQCVAW